LKYFFLWAGSVASLQYLPLVGWSRSVPVASEAQEPVSMRMIPASECGQVLSQSRCLRAVGHRSFPDQVSSGSLLVPTLRSLLLGYVAPFVADITEESATHLPTSIRASLIALARCVHQVAASPTLS